MFLVPLIMGLPASEARIVWIRGSCPIASSWGEEGQSFVEKSRLGFLPCFFAVPPLQVISLLLHGSGRNLREERRMSWSGGQRRKAAGEGDGKRGASVKAKSKGFARRSDVQELGKEGAQANKLTFPFCSCSSVLTEGPARVWEMIPSVARGRSPPAPCLSHLLIEMKSAVQDP